MTGCASTAMPEFDRVQVPADRPEVVVESSAAPASAHDELLASTPTAQAQLHELPEEIELTFSALTVSLAVTRPRY